MPCRCKRTCLSLTVTDDYRSYKVGIIKYRTECMGYGITKFTALIDGTGCLGSNVAGDTAGE